MYLRTPSSGGEKKGKGNFQDQDHKWHHFFKYPRHNNKRKSSFKKKILTTPRFP